MVTVKDTPRLGRQNNLRLPGNLPGKLVSTSLPHSSPNHVPRFARFAACLRSLRSWGELPDGPARCEETPAGVGRKGVLQEEVGEGWTEVACHPGYASPDFSSVYLQEREEEVRTLTDQRIRQTSEALGIHLVNYTDYLTRHIQ